MNSDRRRRVAKAGQYNEVPMFQEATKSAARLDSRKCGQSIFDALASIVVLSASELQWNETQTVDLCVCVCVCVCVYLCVTQRSPQHCVRLSCEGARGESLPKGLSRQGSALITVSSYCKL